MHHRLFKFARGHEIVGYLEQVAGDHVGVCLPLHAGITFIGRSRGMCEFRAPEALSGVIEAAQILLEIDGRRCWVADATSTNPTTLVRSQHRESYLASGPESGPRIAPRRGRRVQGDGDREIAALFPVLGNATRGPAPQASRREPFRTGRYLADAVGCPREGVIELRQESFGVAMNARAWIQVRPGDLLAHCYGCWTVVLTETGASEEQDP